MALTVERFLQGMTTQEHMAGMKINKDRFAKVFEGVEIAPEDVEYFANLATPLRVAVITEDWCGDHVSTTPVMYRIAEGSPKLEVRVFMRDQNWDLADSLLPQHRRDTVPVFAFFEGETMRHLGLFIETSPKLIPMLGSMEDEIREMHPEMLDIKNDINEMSERTRNVFREERNAYRINHAPQWGRIIAQGFREVVAEGLTKKPGEGPAEGGTKWPPG
jgi:hypothetical protein